MFWDRFDLIRTPVKKSSYGTVHSQGTGLPESKFSQHYIREITFPHAAI